MVESGKGFFTEDDPVKQQLSDMHNSLKYPAQKEKFFQKPDARVQLLKFIARAKEYADKYDDRFYLRHFGDYLADYDAYLLEMRNRPYRLLCAIMEREEQERKARQEQLLAPLREWGQEIEAKKKHEQSRNEQAVYYSPVYQIELMPEPEPKFEQTLEMQALINQLQALQLENEDLSQAPKRCKFYHEDGFDLLSLQMMEEELAIKVAVNQYQTLKLLADIMVDEVGDQKRPKRKFEA